MCFLYIRILTDPGSYGRKYETLALFQDLKNASFTFHRQAMWYACYLYLCLCVDSDEGIDTGGDAWRKQHKDICNIMLLNLYSLWIQSDSLHIFLKQDKINKLEFSLCSNKYPQIGCHCTSHKNKTFWIILMFKCILVLSIGKVLWTHLSVDVDSIEMKVHVQEHPNILEDYF